MAADDDVDLLIDSWSGRLTSVDLTPLDVMSRLRRAALALAEVRRDVFKEAGLGDGEFEVLAALRRIDPYGVSPTRLLSLVTCDITTLKRRTARLLSRGLIHRESAPEGARGTIITLTSSGRARVDGAMENLIMREREMLAALSSEDLVGLEKGLRLVLEGAEQTKRQRAGGDQAG